MSWDTLLQLFRELPETSKLIIFIWFIVIFIGYTVWWILSWRNERKLTKDLKRTSKQLQEVTQDRDQLQERLLALDRVDSQEAEDSRIRVTFRETNGRRDSSPWSISRGASGKRR